MEKLDYNTINSIGELLFDALEKDDFLNSIYDESARKLREYKEMASFMRGAECAFEHVLLIIELKINMLKQDAKPLLMNHSKREFSSRKAVECSSLTKKPSAEIRKKETDFDGFEEAKVHFETHMEDYLPGQRVFLNNILNNGKSSKKITLKQRNQFIDAYLSVIEETDPSPKTSPSFEDDPLGSSAE